MKYISFFCLCLFILSACTCEEEGITTIEEPDPFYVVQCGGGDDFFFIEFSKPVDTAQFFFQENAVFTPVNLCDPDISWSPDNTRLSFCASYIDCDFNNQLFQCFLTISLLGTVSDGLLPVQSDAGQILDGDLDGKDGGDFVKPVTIIL